MPEGYCDKCKARIEIADGVEEITKTGRCAITGKCPKCGNEMLKITGGQGASFPCPDTPSISGTD